VKPNRRETVTIGRSVAGGRLAISTRQQINPVSSAQTFFAIDDESEGLKDNTMHSGMAISLKAPEIVPAAPVVGGLS
jgi:hypothetical protein